MRLKLPYWPIVHKLLVKYQKLVRLLFLFAYLAVLGLIFLGFYLFKLDRTLFALLAGFAGEFGTIAFLLFLGSLVPGILQRFRVFPILSASIVLFRRQVGILMYFMALLHFAYIYAIPAFATSSLGLETLPYNGLSGLATLLILLPVWLTSNDTSQKLFGRLWKPLQRLSYLAMVSILIHVALIEASKALLAGGFVALETLSWLVWGLKARSRK